MFLMVAIVIGVRWNLSVFLIYISFMSRDSEHFFMCFLAIWALSFEKILFSSVAYFLTGLLIVGEFSFFEPSVYSGYQSFDV
jgi:hypothetical protein